MAAEQGTKAGTGWSLNIDGFPEKGSPEKVADDRSTFSFVLCINIECGAIAEDLVIPARLWSLATACSSEIHLTQASVQLRRHLLDLYLLSLADQLFLFGDLATTM